MTDPSLLEKIKQLVHASLRPLPPRYGDGRYNSDVSPETIKTGIIKDLASQATRIPEDIDIVVDAIAVLYRNGLIDDSKFFVSLCLSCCLLFQMEKIIQFLASLPSTSAIQAKITDGLVSNLWNVLLHPPLSYVGDLHQYRSADGSYNVSYFLFVYLFQNIMYPHLGKAGTEYAKSVKPQLAQHGAAPDPGILFDGIYETN